MTRTPPRAARAASIWRLRSSARRCCCIAFVMLAAGEPSGSLQIRDVVAALPASPWRDAALALIIIGFGMKIALVPLHGWMPLSLYGGARFRPRRC